MLAAKHPGDAAKIVIMDALPLYGMMFGPTITPAMIQGQAAAMRDKLAAQTPEQRRAGAAATATTLVIDPHGRQMVENNSEDSDASVFSRAMYGDLQTDVRPELAGIKVPVLMLYPYDKTLTLPNGMSLTIEQVDGFYGGAYRPVPNLKLVRVDASRHFIMLDQPAKFDELLEPFLR